LRFRSHSTPGPRTYDGGVITAPRLDPSTFPDSPYAAELQRGSPRLRFAPPLEAEFQRARLLDSRTLIRVAQTFSALMALVRGAELFHEGVWSIALLDLFLVVASSVFLAMISWGPRFEHLYPRWARLIVPSRNAVVAAHIAGAATHGQPEMLMVLPIVLVGPFFFLGLPLRTTLVCCALTIASYATFATLFGMPEAGFIRSNVLLLGGIAACLIAFWNLEKTSRLSFLEGNLIAELAQRDPLTGAKNRRAFDEQLDQLWRQAVDNDKALAIALIDVDHFKAYNDQYGHQAGDQTLRRVAQTVQKFVRQPPDLLTRYGGEEFAAILYDISDERARDTAERIRQAVAELAIEHRASRTASRVTISIGVAAIRPSAERNPRGALQLADQALYEAKVEGRNRVALMDDTQHDLLVTGVFAVNPDHSAGNDRAA
jgi:diguanylate cyclase (GGDEF)-like protein